jgi:hypothetical protein
MPYGVQYGVWIRRRAAMETRLFSTRELRALKPKAKLYRVGECAPRGEGRLYVTVHPSGLKEFYYRIRTARLDRSVRIGHFEQTPGQGGITLEEAPEGTRSPGRATPWHRRREG